MADLNADLNTFASTDAFYDADELRRDLGAIEAAAARRRDVALGGLVGLDISRALVALGAAELAIARGHRHADLEAPA